MTPTRHRIPAHRGARAVLLGALALAAAPAFAAGPDGDAILGVWRGSSLCTDREVAPACKDEQVRYDFTHAADAPAGSYHLAADKLVGGEYARMGDLDFTFDAGKGEWTSEFRTARVHGIWSLHLGGEGLEGNLIDVPSGRVVRRVSVHRD